MVNFIVAEFVERVLCVEDVVSCVVSRAAASMVLPDGIYAERAMEYDKIAEAFPSSGGPWCHCKMKPYPLV